MPWKHARRRPVGRRKTFEDTSHHYETAPASSASGTKVWAPEAAGTALARGGPGRPQRCSNRRIGRRASSIGMDEEETHMDSGKVHATRRAAEPTMFGWLGLRTDRHGVEAGRGRDRSPVLVSVQIVGADKATGGLWRFCAFPRYNTQTIVEDALGMGPGARLEVSVPSHVSDDAVRTLDNRLAKLRARNIHVSIRRTPLASVPREWTPPDAA